LAPLFIAKIKNYFFLMRKKLSLQGTGPRNIIHLINLQIRYSKLIKIIQFVFKVAGLAIQKLKEKIIMQLEKN